MAALTFVDPLDGRQVWLEHVRHEAGHALAAVLLDFTFADVHMDPYHDYGHWGMLSGLRRDPLTSEVPATDDVLADFKAIEYALYRDALDRSIVARLGVMSTLAQEWNRPDSGDQLFVESQRPSEFSAGAWDLLVEHSASRLLRREDFRFRHADIVRALEREGRLTYEQVFALATGSPDAAPPSNGDAASPIVATSARRPKEGVGSTHPLPFSRPRSS